jgi:hypothetical protein
VAVLAALFFCSVSLGDLVSPYGSIRGGGGFAGGGSGGFSGGGEVRLSEQVGFCLLLSSRFEEALTKLASLLISCLLF